jgi:hypothetical protein
MRSHFDRSTARAQVMTLLTLPIETPAYRGRLSVGAPSPFLTVTVNKE